MNRSTMIRCLCLSCCGAVLALGIGCGGSSGGAKFIPKPATARSALEAALTAWQNGQPPTNLSVESTPVEVIDSKWKAGQRLSRFEIVGDDGGKGPKWFSVKLHMQKPAGERTVRFVVIGNSPLWIYREDDYQRDRNSGM